MADDMPKPVVGAHEVENFVGEGLQNLYSGLNRRDRENLATGIARGGFDNTAITVRGIRGLFYDALELASQAVWATRVGLHVPMTTRTETLAWLGALSEPRKHIGGLNSTGVDDVSLTLTALDYEKTLEVSSHDLRWDQVGALSRRVGEMSSIWADHWNKLSVDSMEANDTAYDGVALFSASHSIGDSGTMSNLLTASDLDSLNISDSNRPTKAEASAIMADLAAYFYRYKDHAGRPANQGAKSFVLLCHPAALPGFLNALRDQFYVQGGSNELRSLGQMFDVVSDPRLSSQTVIYMFRADGVGTKPLVLGEAIAPTLQVIGPDSEHAIKNNSVLYVTKASRCVVPGEFRHVIKATMS